MSSTILNKVNSKLKHLPENILEEVDKYIEFLTFKYGQEIPHWQKEILDERLEDLENLEKIKSVETLFKVLDEEV